MCAFWLEAKNATAAFEQALATPQKQLYVLQLYVTGMTPRSTRAIANAKKICEEHLQGQYDLSVIDVYQQPQLAKDAQILAVPTLVASSKPGTRKPKQCSASLPMRSSAGQSK